MLFHVEEVVCFEIAVWFNFSWGYINCSAGFIFATLNN